MSRSLKKVASLALVTPLAGAMLFAASAPASAAPVKVAAPAKAVTAVADDPYSVFKVSVKAPAKVKAGGKITYSISAKNTGPYVADAYYIGGKLPKGIVGTVYYNGPKGTQCAWDESGFWCWGDWALEVGETDALKIHVKLKKSTKGHARAQLGVIAYDVPTGAENLSKEELDRIGGIKGWLFAKNVKTKIVR
ncbi:putative repeat protein (TIGR01451 family) [Thermocatellispora tengchongensis]|uniref:Putative repeat protein (TIGR01451 family) n=1 Tax=Thermocatellispora tengchongensis TaxID=1073253 RepID=A0A840PID1_9ACTN|nr:DUF11 domain-containing protein [Thermocatellispora tengchongensis]MBB5137663.1 putative repeat protein (TIGR01451 family) [Thermocatellispora tengchongensis]